MSPWLIKYICKVFIVGILAGGEREIRGNTKGKQKDTIVHIPNHRPLGLLFYIAQFEMQLQGTMPIECEECEHITKTAWWHSVC